MSGLGVVSADSHMMEPADLWQERLDRPFRDRAPKVIENSSVDREELQRVPELVERKIVRDNAVELYRMALD